MQPRITIITLGVKNLAQSTQFYVEKFGWKKDASSTEGITFFRLNNMLLGLYPQDKLEEDIWIPMQKMGSTSTFAYNVSSQKEVDEICADLEKRGVDIVKNPQEVFWGGYSGYISDLDGNHWEIVHNPYLSLDTEGNIV